MRKTLTVAALAWFLIWVVSGILLLLRAQAISDGIHPGWLEPSGPLRLSVDTLRVALIAVCWIGSIYVWSSAEGRGPGRVLTLIALVFFGMLIGPFYILLVGRRIGGPGAGATASRLEA